MRALNDDGEWVESAAVTPRPASKLGGIQTSRSYRELFRREGPLARSIRKRRSAPGVALVIATCTVLGGIGGMGVVLWVGLLVYLLLLLLAVILVVTTGCFGLIVLWALVAFLGTPEFQAWSLYALLAGAASGGTVGLAAAVLGQVYREPGGQGDAVEPAGEEPGPSPR